MRKNILIIYLIIANEPDNNNIPDGEKNGIT